jgi:hypothetical protein
MFEELFFKSFRKNSITAGVRDILGYGFSAFPGNVAVNVDTV